VTEAELLDIERRALESGQTDAGGDTLKLVVELRRLQSLLAAKHRLLECGPIPVTDDPQLCSWR
jgi:hypothetical protein